MKQEHITLEQDIVTTVIATDGVCRHFDQVRIPQHVPIELGVYRGRRLTDTAWLNRIAVRCAPY